MNRLGIGPITRQLVGRDADRLNARAAAMGVAVSTKVRGSRYRTWTVTVIGSRITHLQGHGSVVAMIDAALDDYAAAA